jgi:hypothetical protein
MRPIIYPLKYELFRGGFLSGGTRIIPALIFNRKPFDPNPLDQNLPTYVQSDQGLTYGTFAEEMEKGYSGSRIF